MNFSPNLLFMSSYVAAGGLILMSNMQMSMPLRNEKNDWMSFEEKEMVESLNAKEICFWSIPVGWRTKLE